MKTYLLVGAVLAATPLHLAVAADALSAQDKTFVQQAAAGGMAEVQEGQLATAKAKADKVKKFGQMMVTDHTANNHELMTLAEKKGVTPAASLDDKHAQEVAMLQKQDGDFDGAYIDGQIKGHQAMAAVMQMEIRSGGDADLKAFAQKTLPVVQQHLQMAESLQSASTAGGAAPAASMAPAASTASTDTDKAPNGSLEKYHGSLRATELSGANVYNDQGTAIGTVNDILLGDDGKVRDVVLSVGGFLGLGTHYVSVPFNDIQVKPSRGSDTSTTAPAATAPATTATPGATGGATTGTPAAMTDTAAKTQYFSLVLPGSTKDSLTKMLEFRYRG